VPALLELDGKIFAGGRSRFLDSDGGTEPTPKIFVKILPGHAPVPVLAQLDTGAAWSVLDGEIAEALGFFEHAGPIVSLSTRSGAIDGRLIRAPLTLVADEGESFEVEATFFVSRDWTYGSFLGYSGLLEADPLRYRSRDERFLLRRNPGLMTATGKSERSPFCSAAFQGECSVPAGISFPKPLSKPSQTRR